jgi:hypothetical protein
MEQSYPVGQGFGQCEYCCEDGVDLIVTSCKFTSNSKFCKPCLNRYWKTYYDSFLYKHELIPICECSFHSWDYNEIKPFLDEDVQVMAEKWFARYEDEEYQTPIAERVYCAQAACGKFLCPKTRAIKEAKDSILVSELCSTSTCLRCRQVIDPASNDPYQTHASVCNPRRIDPNIKWVLSEDETQQCPECHNIITSAGGCPDMECLCGAKFCVVCGALNDEIACDCPESDSEEEEAASTDGMDVEGDGETSKTAGYGGA